MEGVDELIFGIAAIDRDDLDVRGEMRLGAFPGQNGEVESRVLVNGGADGGTDVPAGLSSIRRHLFNTTPGNLLTPAMTTFLMDISLASRFKEV